MNKKLIILISVIAVCALFFFVWQNMSFSKEILKVEIIGPEKASVGEEIEYIVKFKNNGAVRLENPELTFEFPEGAIIDQGTRIQRKTADEIQGDIYPGQERTIKFTTRYLGKENDAKTVKATISFQPKDLKSRNEVTTSFTTILNEVPINFTLDIPAETASGKAFSFRINYSSNVNYPLEDISFIIQYPDGFEFLYSQPKALENTQWDIPILNEAGSGKIEVSGILTGNSQEQKIFRARMGIWKDGNFILLKESIKGIQIASPSLYITQKLNNSEDYIASTGDHLHYEVFFRNLSETPSTNMILIIRLEGSSLDFNSIVAPEGKFEAGDNSIIWEPKNVPDLQYLDPGQEGKIEFWIDVKKDWKMKNLADKNPTIKNKVMINTSRGEFVTKLGTTLEAKQNIYFEDKYFDNSGPYPLEANQKTYVTVEWTANSTFNDVGEAVMKTVLPDNVIYEKKTYPEGVDLVFDEDTRELVWNIGTVEAGSGTLKQSKTCAFQLSVTPQTIEQDIILLGSAQISGIDQWTNKGLSYKTDIVYGETNR
ncbi:MAG TPA: hypothetical protein PK476_01730 [Candidatus Pacearchaeota archaeon]|nr:hypothetical protein [Candidatus Pacearchaeota archaeon]HQM24613.1 hypothetical protein [Candidatus Pacearchaeota archaeon]